MHTPLPPDSFSCKGRGMCQSCCTRRMAETAADPARRDGPDHPVRYTPALLLAMLWFWLMDVL